MPMDSCASLVDREARGTPISLPDGATVPRLPGYALWMWDGEFCGSIGLRWQPGPKRCRRIASVTSATPSLPWKRGTRLCDAGAA